MEKTKDIPPTYKVFSIGEIQKAIDSLPLSGGVIDCTSLPPATKGLPQSKGYVIRQRPLRESS